MLIDFECLADHLLEMIDLLMTLDAEIEEYAAFTWIERYPEELLLDEANLWNGQRYIHVGFERHGDAVAVRALDRGLVQAVHHVDDDGLVALQVVLPSLAAVFDVVVAFRFENRD